MNSIDQIKPGDVLLDPHNKTTMWRLLEIDKGSDQVRLVRSNKTGGIHGLVKDPTGHWEPTQKIQKFVVIANYQGPDAPRPATARSIRNSQKQQAVHATPVLEAPLERRRRLSADADVKAAEAPRVDGSRDLLQFMKTFHESMAKGIEEMIRSR